MMNDWVPTCLRSGDATVYCKTCGEKTQFNEMNAVYECKCEFGATVEALAHGLDGYTWECNESGEKMIGTTK
jgi:hypothetical protein